MVIIIIIISWNIDIYIYTCVCVRVCVDHIHVYTLDPLYICRHDSCFDDDIMIDEMTKKKTLNLWLF